MSEEFVPLSAFLHRMPEPPLEHQLPPEPEPDVPVAPDRRDEDLRAVLLFRAALADALDVAIDGLLRSIARDVLARELRLEPADVAGIVAAALDRHAGEKVLSIRAHPADLPALAEVAAARIADDDLRRGDIVIEVRSGTIDMRLSARLEAALAAVAA